MNARIEGLTCRPFHCEYRVVEISVWSFWNYCAAIGVDKHKLRIHSNVAQQAGKQRGFILAIAVSIAEDVSCKMGLIASYADLNGYVADLLLQEACQGGGFIEGCGESGCQLAGALGDLGRIVASIIGEGCVPAADVFPRSEAERFLRAVIGESHSCRNR